MKNITYDPKSRRINANINGIILNLNPVIKTLDLIGNSIIQNPRTKIELVHHCEYIKVCPYQLHGTASTASEKFFYIIPNINPEIIDFASTEIGLGNVSISRLYRKNHEEQILRALEDIGKTWQYTENKEEAETQIKIYGIPLLISTKGLSEKERLERFRRDYIFINEKSIVRQTMINYDKAMLKENHEDKEKYSSLDLDDIALGIGLNLYEAGLSPIKLYEKD